MKKTINLIFKTVLEVDKKLLVNWFFYSLGVVVFSVFWVLFPEKLLQAIYMGGKSNFIHAILLGLLASGAVFLTTFLSNNAWMKINRVRYSILLNLLGASLRLPYSKTLDSDYLSKLEKTRTATINPSVGIGRVMSSSYEMPGMIFSAIGLFGIISRVSPYLSIFVVATVIVSYKINTLLNQIDQKEWNKSSGPRRKFEKAYDLLMERDYAKDIRMFSFAGLLDSYGKFYSGRIFDLQNQSKKEKRGYQTLDLINQFSLSVVVYIWLAVYIFTDRLGIGSFLTYALGTIHLGLSMQAILIQSSYIAKEGDKFSDYWSILEDAKQPSSDPVLAKERFDATQYSIEFDQVSFTYPNAKEPAIDDVSFRLEPGCRAGLVGLNGAGKTTIIKLLCRLYSPTKGRIRVNGVDIQDISLEEYYDLLNVVFQDGSILPFSIGDNIMMSKLYDHGDFQHAVHLSDFSRVLNHLPEKEDTFMTHIMNPDGIELSGGETQKLLMARAIYHGRKIFLLDEPAGALDPIAEEEIYANYSKITEGATGIIISHQLSFVVSCDYIILLKEGKILEQGTHSDLLERQGQYYEMFMEQKRQYEEK